MAGRRAPAKETLSRPNDQARREAGVTKAAADGVVRGPDLPEGDWHPRTLAWWQTWRTSAQSRQFIPTDWDALSEAALLHTRMWNGEVSVAPELRLRVAKFGATLEDRQKLKLSIDPDEVAGATTQPTASVSAARKRRILRAVGDGS